MNKGKQGLEKQPPSLPQLKPKAIPQRKKEIIKLYRKPRKQWTQADWELHEQKLMWELKYKGLGTVVQEAFGKRYY